MSGRRIIIVGLFSAKDDGHEATTGPSGAAGGAERSDTMDALAAALAHDGNVVVGRVVQRRGVSRARGPGGAGRMDAAMDAATYIGRGKATEVAQLRRSTNADLVVVRGSPSATQLARLREIIGCEVVASAASPN